MHQFNSDFSEKSGFLNLLKDNIFYFLLDRELNILAVNRDIVYCQRRDFTDIILDLKKIFTNKSLNKLKKIISSNSFSPVDIVLEKLNGEICTGKVVTLHLKDNKDVYLLELKTGLVLSENKIEEDEDLINSVSFMLLGLAHELKNPLAGIKVLADMIVCECEKEEEIKGFVSKILKNVDRVNAILDVFFSYIKVDKEFKSFFSVNSLLEDLMIFSGFKAKRAGIELEVNVEQENLFIYGNKNKVLNLFMNLLDNAIDAVKAKKDFQKRIEISVSAFEDFQLDSSCVNGFKEEFKDKKIIGVKVEIKDTGIGMDDFEKKHIFDAFFTTKDSGVGLGLSMVLKYVKENCGDIFFESEKGKGSVFKVVLPGVRDFKN